MVASPCAVERLESRIAPAAANLVHVYFNHGDLFLVGDGGEHSVAIEAGDGSQILLFSGDVSLQVGTAEPTTELSFSGPLRDVHYVSGAGTDSLTISGFKTLRNVTVNMGPGSADFSLYSSNLQGSLKVATGPGESSLFLVDGAGATTTVGGDVVLDLKGSENQAEFDGALKIQGGLTYRGGPGLDELKLDVSSLEILRGFDFQAGNGDATLEIAATSGFTIGGGLNVVTGTKSGGYADISFSSGEMFFVGGNTRIALPGGFDQVSFTAPELHFGHDLNLRLAGETDFYEPAILNVATPSLYVGGSITVSSSSFIKTTIAATGSAVIGGNLSVHGGVNTGTIFDFQAPGSIGGKVLLDVAELGTQLSIAGTTDSPLTILGGLSLTARAGKFAGLIIGFPGGVDLQLTDVILKGPSSVLGGRFFDNVSLTRVKLGGSLSMNLGASDDSVTADETVALTAAAVTIAMGRGDDSIFWSAPLDVPSTARFTFAGGLGEDSLSLAGISEFSRPPVITGMEFV